jgi:hypothetical protein
LSSAIIEAKRTCSLKGINVGRYFFFTHLLFVDDILLFSYGSRREVDKINATLELYDACLGMDTNRKSLIVFIGMEEEFKRMILQVFPFHRSDFQEGFKYFMFYLKPNDY